MGFGKAQKQKRNRERKAKIKAQKKAEILNTIRSLKNERSYQIKRDDGEYLFNGLFLTGLEWKVLYKIHIE